MNGLIKLIAANPDVMAAVAFIIGAVIGQAGHAVKKWTEGEVTTPMDWATNNLRRTVGAVMGNLIGMTAFIATGVLTPMITTPNGWWSVFVFGFMNGFTADSALNKSIRQVWTPEERAANNDPDATTPGTKPSGFALVELLIALGITATVAATMWGAIEYLHGVEKDADAAGYNRAVGEVLKRDKTDLLRAQGQIKDLMLEKAAADEAHATEQARLAGLHAKEVADEKAKTADTQRRIRTGELVLVDPGKPGPSGAGGCNAPGDRGGSPALAATTPAAGSGQAQPEGISPAFAGFLAGEASLADEVASDLALCWGIARDDRARLARRL